MLVLRFLFSLEKLSSECVENIKYLSFVKLKCMLEKGRDECLPLRANFHQTTTTRITCIRLVIQRKSTQEVNGRKASLLLKHMLLVLI